MNKEILELQKELRSDKRFFDNYEPGFIDSFHQNMSLIKPGLLSNSALNTFGAKLFRLLFDLSNDPFDELYAFSLKLAEHEINIKPIIIKSLLTMIQDFAVYMIEEQKEIGSLKALTMLIEQYLITIEKANEDYLQQLKKELISEREQKQSQQAAIILHALNAIKEKNEDVKLLGYFKELPVICKTKILSCQDNVVELDISKCYSSLFRSHNEIYIKSALFPKPITGAALVVATKTDILQMSNLEFTELPQESRKFIRVEPTALIEVTIEKGREKFSGSIGDISVGGVSLLTIEKTGLSRDDHIVITFILNSQEIIAEGIIRYDLNIKKLHQLGIEFIQNTKVEERVSEYVTNRQFEILKEIKSHQRD